MPKSESRKQAAPKSKHGFGIFEVLPMPEDGQVSAPDGSSGSAGSSLKCVRLS